MPNPLIDPIRDIVVPPDTGGGGGDPTSVGSHTYWRMEVLGTARTDFFFTTLAEMELRATAGGATQTTGGTPTASDDGGGEVANAFDGDTATIWAPGNSVGLGYAWIRYQFVSPVSVAELMLVSGDSGVRAARMPRTLSLQFSDDGTTWETVVIIADIPLWTATETRTFSIPETYLAGRPLYRYTS